MAVNDEPAKLILPYLQRADELQKHDHLVAYYCRLYAMERGLGIPAKERTKDTNALLLSLMGQLEKDKKVVSVDRAHDSLYLEGFAQSVFAKADKQDRAGRADLNTAKTFYAAGIFLDVLRQFGDLPADLEQKQKYAVWKAGDIRKALKEGRQPLAGPPRDSTGPEQPSSDSNNLTSATLTSDSFNLLPSQPQPGNGLTSFASFPTELSQHSPLVPPPRSFSEGEQPSAQGSATWVTSPGGRPQGGDTWITPPGGRPQGGDDYGLPSAPSGTFGPSLDSSSYSRPSNPPGSFSGQDSHPSSGGQLALSFPGAGSGSSQGVSPGTGPHSAAYGTPVYSSPAAVPFNSPPSSLYSSSASSFSHPSSLSALPPNYSAAIPAIPYSAPVGAQSDRASSTIPQAGQASGFAGPTVAQPSPYQPSPDKVAEAHKSARFAVSALAFDDVPTALSYLQRSLELLTVPSTTL